MSNFGAARERHSKSTKQQSFRRNDYAEARFVEIDIKKLEKAKYRFRLLPPVAGKIGEVPLCFSRSRLEVVRQPEIPKPANPEKFNYATENEWALSSLSYPEDSEDAPKAIDTLLEVAAECGFLVEGKGFQHSNKAVVEAVEGLIPWTQYMIPCLAQATKKEIGRRTSGDREYVTYTLVPAKIDDYSAWVPVVLCVENNNVINFFYDKGIEWLEDNQQKTLWGRKTGATMVLTKGQRYELDIVKSREGEIDAALYKDLQEGMPDYQTRMINLQKTDDDICDTLTRCWWWKHALKRYPALGEIFEEVGDTESWDDDGEAPATEDDESFEDEDEETVESAVEDDDDE